MTSRLTGLRARTTAVSYRSFLTGLRARTVGSTGTSRLTGLRARTVSSTGGTSRLTSLRARNFTQSAPVAQLSGPAAVDVWETFILSLASSQGGPFTSYAIIQTLGPTVKSLTMVGDHAVIVAPAVKPLAAGYPNDIAPTMTFQGTVTSSLGISNTTLTVSVYPHLTWSADGQPLFWMPALTSTPGVLVVDNGRVDQGTVAGVGLLVLDSGRVDEGIVSP